jgi:uncharacterized protein YdeI (YjbR/CyaY-like superfamily)
MAAVQVDPDKIYEFSDGEVFYAWLAAHHATEREAWIRIYKVGSLQPSITAAEAVDVALCWGWIDAIRKRFDERSYLQRYTPRRPKSLWSRINVANVERLIAEGRMTEHGLQQVAAAKADGRWARAYGSGKDMPIPEDLQAAIDAVPDAKAMLARLNERNRFAIAFRMHNLQSAAARQRWIRKFVDMLARGETPYPQRGQPESS